MGFIVLLSVGAILGWTATILTRRDDGQAILLSVAVGMIGALAGGVMTSNESLMRGVSAVSLGAGAIGALVLLAFVTYTRQYTAR